MEAEGITDALALLDESRMNLAQSRVRLVNQLHALLRELLAGGAPTDLRPPRPPRCCATSVQPVTRAGPQADRRRLITQIRSVDALLKSNAKQIRELVAASGSTLTDTVGIGAITAGRLIGRTGRADRFPSSASFANYAGAAPIEIASAARPGTACPEAATASSTPRCTPSRSPRSEHQAATATPTTTPRSPRARPPAKRDGVSNGASPITSGAP